ncbi:MAG: tryptophan 7-halogenase [Okeania sp. SIO2G4]|uniref:tryptophan halogenase family protein n=1 Tax=unclassified Okeania TaxID=2634635 RepID=UPI0013BA0186|nr:MULTISPECIES: tryptophan halogenase family protein [unclassified Okeania]NEP06748.1 tryptophan 7-halogenase [Okeania sp. SIO4D6]NEP73970.1 tryptophan 7-halogenase [Okeania sp. SIO2G5]NEP94785.1 tryptophan 7-halogenase [Okeania sp. SIO2F5]NEQ92481.1 tryptophan 7-halogenase [Okeania sp. SIO2G4]
MLQQQTHSYPENIRNVLIVGGGTAGWMTAAYLNKAFGPQVKVTLMETPSVPRIGVGEATVPNLQRAFWDFLGIPEQEWMKHVNGAYKTSIRFVNWRKCKPGEKSNYFYHPFGILPNINGILLTHYWYHQTKGSTPIEYSCFREPPLLDANKAPVFMDGTSAVPHAWHFDANLVVKFLSEWAQERGVELMLDSLKDTTLDEQGNITSIHTKNGRTVEADLFIDCTGFRGLLINKVLGEPFIDMSDYLLCDRAVSAIVAHEDEKYGIEPFTSSFAQEAGWIWKTPLMGRFGSGYVYSSKFISEDEAATKFSKFWNLDESKTELRRIQFKTGRNRRSWVKNCVSIGLSSCFLEPLESTGIYFITGAIYQLAKYFPTRQIEPALRDRFNREIEYMYDDCRDFIQAHYFTTTRDDSPFWLANKHELTVSESIKEKIALYKAGLPVSPLPSNEDNYYGSLDNEFHNFWTDGSYYCVLSGLGCLPEQSHTQMHYHPDRVEKSLEIFKQIKQQQQELLEHLPNHYDYLRQLHHVT